MLGILAGVQAAVSIGSAIAGHRGQRKEARAHRRNIDRSLRLHRDDLMIQEGRILDAAAQSRQEASRVATGVEGRARASAASGGVRGASVDAIISEVSGDLARVYSSIEFNEVASLLDIQRAREAAEIRAEAERAGVSDPSFFETLARIGGGAMDAAALYRRFSQVPGSDVKDPEDKG
jgi:hypothetical protein